MGGDVVTQSRHVARELGRFIGFPLTYDEFLKRLTPVNIAASTFLLDGRERQEIPPLGPDREVTRL